MTKSKRWQRKRRRSRGPRANGETFIVPTLSPGVEITQVIYTNEWPRLLIGRDAFIKHYE